MSSTSEFTVPLHDSNKTREVRQNSSYQRAVDIYQQLWGLFAPALPTADAGLLAELYECLAQLARNYPLNTISPTGQPVRNSVEGWLVNLDGAAQLQAHEILDQFEFEFPEHGPQPNDEFGKFTRRTLLEGVIAYSMFASHTSASLEVELLRNKWLSVERQLGAGGFFDPVSYPQGEQVAEWHQIILYIWDHYGAPRPRATTLIVHP